ncbi:MAG TPA: glycosyltransferase family 4 protein, partial [Streptosporangiaceae bacterium]
SVACSAGGDLTIDVEAAGVPVRVVGTRPAKRRLDYGFARALRGLITQDPPDLVHAHMFASATAAERAVRGTGIPLVIHEHSEAGWRDHRARQVAAASYQRSAAVIAVSEAIRRRLAELDQVPAAKIHVLPNTLPLLPGRPAQAPLPRLRPGPLVGMAARLRPEKGGEVFLRAAARLARRFPAVGFVVIGDGPQRAALERLASCLRLPVTFLGFRPDGPALIAGLDVLVVPSFTEGTPLVVLEAAAAGVPVIASAVGGIPEQVRDGIGALLVPPGDEDAVAAACALVLADPGLGARLAESAHRRVRRAAGPQAALDAVQAIYERVLSARRAVPDLRAGLP